MSVAASTRLPATAEPRPPRYPATYWILVGGFGISRIGAVLIPYLTLYLVNQRHLTSGSAGQVLAAFGAGWIAGQPLAGAAADRLGRKPTILASLTMTAGAYTLLTVATTISELIALAALIGLVFDGARTAITAWIADLVPAHARTSSFSIQYWLINAGGAVSGILGGYLASDHLTWLCLVDAGTCAAFAAVILTLPHRTEAPTQTPALAAPGQAASVRAALADRRLLAFTILTLLTLTAYQQMTYGIPLTIRAAGLPPTTYATVTVVNAVAVLTLQPLLQPVIKRLRPLHNCVAGSLAITVGMAANAPARSTAGFALAAVVWTVGEVAFFVGATSYVADLAPDHARGRYFGIWGASLGGSALLAPLLGGAVLPHGTDSLWACTAAIGALSAAGLALQAARARRHREPTSPDS